MANKTSNISQMIVPNCLILPYYLFFSLVHSKHCLLNILSKGIIVLNFRIGLDFLLCNLILPLYYTQLNYNVLDFKSNLRSFTFSSILQKVLYCVFVNSNILLFLSGRWRAFKLMISLSWGSVLQVRLFFRKLWAWACSTWSHWWESGS